MNKCKKIGASHIGVRTRAQAHAMAKRTRGDDRTVIGLKRRRRLGQESSVQLATSQDNSRGRGSGSDHVLEASPSAFEQQRIGNDDGSVEEFDTITCSLLEDGYRRETTNSSEMPSPEPHSPPPKKAPENEIEKFFAAAEKEHQKHFTEKYNYDFAKDVPLKGRYEWVLVKP